MFDFKNNPQWVPFCLFVMGIPTAFLIGFPFVALPALLLLLFFIKKEIFFPISKWKKSFPRFKEYTIAGLFLFSILCFSAAYFDKAQDYLELLFLFMIFWGGYLEWQLFRKNKN